MSRTAAQRVAILAAATLPVSGCTVIGARIGSRSDPPRGSYVSLSEAEIGTLVAGAPVRVVPRSIDPTRVLDGRWGGRIPCPEPELQDAYAQWQRGRGSEAPAWGDSIILRLGTRGAMAGRFAGFDHESLRTRAGGQSIPVDLRLIQRVERAALGITIPGDTIRAWVANGDAPLASGYAITTRSYQPVGPPEFIRLDRVARIERLASRSGRTAGIIFGLACDAVVTAILVSNLDTF